MAETNTPSVKKYVDYAQQQVDEQAILDKYNAATLAQYNIQREQNRQAENEFYNEMYNTQKTAMDTIRQANAAAVSTGASRGVQAANELSALLGLQQESVASATELAQANRQTAQEETAAVLENVLNAYQQAAQERSNLVSQGIEAASVDAQEAANEIAATEAQTNRINAEQNMRDALQKAAQTSFAAYQAEVAGQGIDYSASYSLAGANSLNLALSSLTATGEGQTNDGVYFSQDDFVTSGTSDTAISKYEALKQNLETIQNTYGIDLSQDQTYQDYIQALDTVTHQTTSWSSTGWGKFVNFLTAGLSGSIEGWTSGAGTIDWNDFSDNIVGLIGSLAQTEHSPTTQAQQAQAIYNALTSYIKSQYAAKGQTTQPTA